MIRYDTNPAKLNALINRENDTWLSRAEKRTAAFRRQGFYKEDSPIWSEIKAIYIRLQKGKCAYCERKLEGEVFGKIEWDVEHFRPKKTVKKWRLPGTLNREDINPTPPLSGNKDPGYHLLAYHPLNYCVSCKTCNSTLKKDYFPIADERDQENDNPSNMWEEKPYLVYPVGHIDKDPEDIFFFFGLSPRPKTGEGFERKRALLTIEFFKLDDGLKRQNLFLERARVILLLYPRLKRQTEGATQAERNKATKFVKKIAGDSHPHANCARSFKKLFKDNPAKAGKLFTLIEDFYISKSG